MEKSGCGSMIEKIRRGKKKKKKICCLLNVKRVNLSTDPLTY
jgi:hypothetical protein